MSTLKTDGIRAFAWHFFGRIGAQGIAFIVSIFLARLLEPAEFGLVAMVSVIIAIAQVFTNVGLAAALIQRRRVLPVHYSSVFYFNLSIGALLTLLVFLAAPLIADFYDQRQLEPLAQVMSFAFVINAFSTVQNTILRKQLKFKLLTKIRIASGVISGVVGVLLAFWGAGVWSLVAMSLAAGLSYNAIIWFAAQWQPSLQFSLKALMQLWSFGARMFLAVLLDTLFTKLDVIIIGKLFTPATLGFFQRAKGLNEIVTTYSSGSLVAVLFSLLSKVQKNLPRFQNIAVKTFGIVTFVVFLLIGALFVLAEEIIVLLFSAKWLPSVEYFQILVLSGFAVPVGAVLTTVLSSRGNSRAVLRLEIYKKILLAANLYVGFLFGIMGYLYGLVLVSAAGLLIGMQLASREIELSLVQFITPLLAQLAIATAAVVSVVLLLQPLEMPLAISLFAKGGLFAMLYILLSWLFKTESYRFSHEQLAPVIRRRLLNRRSG
jgi:teichuronic acid exporter